MYSIAKHSLALIIFCVFLLLGSNSVFWGDGGLLLSASYSMGIPHPTGHPLFVMLGKLASMLPLGSMVFRLNLMAAVVCMLCFYLVSSLIKHVLVMMGAGQRDVLAKIIPLISSAAFVLAPAMVYQSNVETYGLNLLLSLIVLLSLIRSRGTHTVFLSMFVLGLAAGNHSLLIFILAIPVIIYAFFAFPAQKRLLFSLNGLAFLILGLSVYLYLPLRAFAGPLVNTGDPSNLRNLVWVITAEQFRENTFSSAGFLSNLSFAKFAFVTKSTIDVLMDNLYYFWVGFTLIGAFLLRRQPLIYLLLSILLLQLAITYPPTITTGVPLADRGVVGYYLLPIAILFIMGSAGFYGLFKYLNKIFKERTVAIIMYTFCSFVMLWTFLSFAMMGNEADRSEDHSANIYGETLLSSMNYGSLFLSITDAGLYIPTYKQVCEDYRTDVQIINRSMFFSPKGKELLSGDMDDYRTIGSPGQNYVKWITEQLDKRHVYMETGTKYRLADDNLAPDLLLFEVVQKGTVVPEGYTDMLDSISDVITAERPSWSEESSRNISFPFYNVGNYFLKKRQWGYAMKQYAVAIEADPGFVEARNNFLVSCINAGNLKTVAALGKVWFDEAGPPVIYFSYALNLVYSGDRERAREVLIKGIERYPGDRMLKGYLGKLERN